MICYDSTITDVQTCDASNPNQVVLLQQSEYSLIGNSPFNLSMIDAQQIAWAIVGVITVALVFRIIIKALETFSDDTNFSE